MKLSRFVVCLSALMCGIVVAEPDAKTTKRSDSCFELGVRYGRCSGKAMNSQKCSGVDDFVMPQRCHGKPETEEGIVAGLRQVFPSGRIPIE